MAKRIVGLTSLSKLKPPSDWVSGDGGGRGKLEMG